MRSIRLKRSGGFKARRAAGNTITYTDTRGKYVQSVDVVNGTVVVTFGFEANLQIASLTMTLTPYETTDLSVVWRCGTANAPAGLQLMGTSGGGNSAAYIPPTVPNQYLPATCRP